MNDLMETVLGQISHQMPLDGIQVQRQLDPDLPVLPGDQERLRQLLNNVILNALQAMEGAGVLSLASRTVPEGVEIRIGDTGPGIAREEQEKIFNPFYTTKKRGTGLGLAVSYGIVQAHEGSIEVDSVPGQGATFIIQLPKREKANF